MNTKIKAQIEAICRAAPTVESCGFVVLNHVSQAAVVPCTNVSPTPETDFHIPIIDYLRAQALGRILYAWHSHPVDAPFSEADKVYADESLIPQRLFNLTSNLWSEYIPPAYHYSLEGRVWCWGEQDCFSLVRDYFRQTHHITIRDYDRDEESNDLAARILAGFTNEGFHKAPTMNQLQKNDVLLFRTNGAPQHMGIFMGNSRVLHHPLMALSRMDSYSVNWQRRLHSILRCDKSLG